MVWLPISTTHWLASLKRLKGLDTRGASAPLFFEGTMEEEKKRRGRPPRPKLYKSTHQTKIFTSKGKVLPGETCELSADEYDSLKAYVVEVDT